MNVQNKLILVFCLLMLFLSCGANAKNNSDENPLSLKKGDPINIKADNLAVMNKKNYAVFKNNVVASQGKMILKADEMQVYTYNDSKENKTKFERIECYGNVDFDSGIKKAKSQKAIYYVKKGLLELTENVYLQDGENTVEGQKFIYEVETGKTSISNNLLSEAKTAEDNLSVKQETGKDEGNKIINGRVKASLIPGEAVKNVEMPSPPPALKKKFEKPKEKGNKKP